MREIPKKNYVFLIIILVVTFILSTVIIDKYKPKKEQYVIKLSEVKENELDNYLVERSETIIYYSSPANENENKLVDKYVLNSEFKEKVVYLNYDEVSIDFEKNFIKKHNGNDISKPCLILIENGKITNIKKIEDNKDIKRFFTIAEVIND